MVDIGGVSQKIVVSSQYFIYFGVMGIFLPYFNLYCYHIGFTGFQIGVLSALRSVTLVVFPLLWGLMADRFQTRRPIYILCNIVSTAVWALYLSTTEFWPMLAITVVFGIFYSPIISFLEAFTMDVLGTEKNRYGRIRVWGSVSFIIMVVAVGKATDLFSIDIIIGLILAGSLLQVLIATRVPPGAPENKQSSDAVKQVFQKKRMAVFLVCAFLMLVSHGAYYGFFSIHLETLGYHRTFIGIAWAVATTAEIFVMIGSQRIFRRFSLENVLVFSFGVAVLRWTLLFFITAPYVILMSQVLHAVTYGTFHMASILYIDRLASDGSKTVGQALNNALTYGLGLMVGFFLNGLLYERFGSFTLFLVSAGVALTGGILLAVFLAGDREKQVTGNRYRDVGME